MIHCVFCDHALSERAPEPPPGPGERWAYDPWKGRLWLVCPRCGRWSPIPLELRWEVLETLEGLVRATGRTLLASSQLSLVEVGPGQVVRIGEPARGEFVGWRYGRRLPALGPVKKGLVQRLLTSLPAAPLGGYNPYGLGSGLPPDAWIASPFLDRASALTMAFTTVPFAPACPSCHRSLLLHPWDFQAVRVVETVGMPRLEARCALCARLVTLTIDEARPALRLGLAVVTNRAELAVGAEDAARILDEVGGCDAFVSALARQGASIGELPPLERVAVVIVLDEQAEIEALEAEWREAEEIAAIMDGELSAVPGFEEFRRRVLGGVGS